MYRNSKDKKILYIDLDGVIVDFDSGVKKLSEKSKLKYATDYSNAPKVFSLMDPMPSAIDAVIKLCENFEVFILSTAPWENHSAWSDKIKWIKHHFGSGESSLLYKKLILTHRKDLNYGDILIDDRTKNGAGNFRGDFILFGSERFPDWDAVLNHLIRD